MVTILKAVNVSFKMPTHTVASRRRQFGSVITAYLAFKKSIRAIMTCISQETSPTWTEIINHFLDRQKKKALQYLKKQGFLMGYQARLVTSKDLM